MKTPEKIKSDIREIDNLLSGATKNSDPKSLANLRSEKENLKTLVLYLETGVTEESLIKQLNALTGKIKLIADRFDAWHQNNHRNYKNRQAALSFYEKINNLPKLRAQENTLNYLLS